MKLVDAYLDSRWYVKFGVRCTAGFLALDLATADANISHEGGGVFVRNATLLAESVMRGEVECVLDHDGAGWPQLECAWGPAAGFTEYNAVTDDPSQTIDEIRTSDGARSVIHAGDTIDGFAISLNPDR